MNFTNKALSSGRRTEPEVTEITAAPESENPGPVGSAKNDNSNGVQDTASIDKDLEVSIPNQEAQIGVQKIEAVTLAWTKPSLVLLLSKSAPSSANMPLSHTDTCL
jgi:hypothetical protein